MAMDLAHDSVFEVDRVEVDQQANAVITDLKLGNSSMRCSLIL